MRRRLVTAFPLYVLHFALILALTLPVSSHAQRQAGSRASGQAGNTAARDARRPPSATGARLAPPPGDGPTVLIPAGADSPQSDPVLAPGVLLLQASTTLVSASQPFSVTVEVKGDPGPSTEGATLSLQFDTALERLTGETSWTLPDVDVTPFAAQLSLRAPQAQAGDVFKITATLAQSGYTAQEKSLLLGVETDAEVTVLLDPQIASGGMRAEVRELPRPEAGQQPGGGMERLVRSWEIEASSARGARAGAMAEPATLVFDADSLIAEGIDPTRLGLYTRADNSDTWQPVVSSYLAEERRFVAHVDHLSQWGLGERLTGGSDLLPNIDAFSSNEFTGYAQLSIPIAAPAGLGGLTPGLSLNYSSGVADDIESIHGPTEYKAQANWVGYGWSMGGLSHISSRFDADYYDLAMNGTVVRIIRQGDGWISDPEQFLRIEHEQSWSGLDVPNTGRNRYDLDDWRITTPDGTVYHFGSHQFAALESSSPTHAGEPLGNWTEVLFYDRRNHHNRRGSRWHLRLVEDTNGNRIEYEYDAETEEFACRNDRSGRVQFYDEDLRYDRMVYPKTIRWSANSGQGIEPKLRVTFTREPRPDFEIEKERCDQARFGKERLKTVRIEAWDNPNGWHGIAEYELGYNQGRHHSLLSSVTRRGKLGQEILRSWRFNYRGSDNAVRLTEADNGLGGSVLYIYGQQAITDCHDCSGVTRNPVRRPVTEAVWSDGTGGEARSVYRYHGIKGHVRDGMFEYLGHAWSQRRRYTRDNDLNIPSHLLEQVVESWYHQHVEERREEIDPRRGLLWQRKVHSADGGLMQQQEVKWGYIELRSGSHWVRRESESVYTFDGDGDDNARVRHTHYFHESTFGNLVGVEERDAEDRKVLRRTETAYSKEDALIQRHIVNRPSRERVEDERGRCIAETRYAYDGNGNLIKSERPISRCGENDAARLIVGRMAYDGAGNVTRAWTEGTSHDIRTEYDAVFHLFPTRRYNANDSSLDETGRYFGINGDDSRAEGGFWGAMQEFCAADGVCTKQAYDSFGRASHRWERGVGHPDRDKAHIQWRYYPWGSMGQNANVVVTQSQPRCEGNFVRKLYDGFGQLIQEQTPRQGWQTRMGGCSDVENALETVVDYAYDGLGRLRRASVPRPVLFAWTHEPNWNAGFTATGYDALGRPASTQAANGATTSYHYNGLTSSVTASGQGEEERRLLSWQQQDQLGRTTLLRSYIPGEKDWTLEAEISLTYDGADRLTQVYRRDAGERRWQRTSSIHYDLAGRKTSMSDADLGSWRYGYNALGQLTRQTDARNQTSCLYYDSLGRMRGRVLRSDENCAATVTDAALSSAYSYDPQGRVQRVANAAVTRTFSYDSYSRLNSESVTVDSLTRTSSYGYDNYHRPTTVTYHGGEVVTTSYGSPGAAVGLSSSVHGTLVDRVSYDEAGRMTALRLPAAGNLWRTQRYYPWTAKRNGGMLESLKVGLSEGAGERLNRSYAYNYFGDITALTEETTSHSFTYDGLGRLTAASGSYNRSYSYDGANRLTAFNGQSYGYGDGGPYHAVDRIGGNDRFDYDANGNMTVRNKGLGSQQTLVWDAQNRLSQVQDNNGSLLEQYWYDVDGGRVKKVSGGTTTYTFFGHYEEEVTGGATTAVSHYSFGGLRVAVKRGSTLYHVHGDHLGSTSMTTAGSVVEGSRAYYPYGARRSASGTLRTDRTFTGQKEDGTGLLYYNARYYDPALGTFISPDSLVPDAGMVIDYNRFLYARGNPLKYSDPSGYTTKAVREWEAKNRWYNERGWFFDSKTQHWSKRGASVITTRQRAEEVLKDAGIVPVGFSKDKELILLAEGVADFARKIGGLAGSDEYTGLARLKTLTGGSVSWYRLEYGIGLCWFGSACVVGATVSFYDSLFTRDDSTIRATAVHELAHVIHNVSCATVLGMDPSCAAQFGVFIGIGYGLPGWAYPRPQQEITTYARRNQWEYWAEAVTDWVYGQAYLPNDPARDHLNVDQIRYIEGILWP